MILGIGPPRQRTGMPVPARDLRRKRKTAERHPMVQRQAIQRQRRQRDQPRTQDDGGLDPGTGCLLAFCRHGWLKFGTTGRLLARILYDSMGAGWNGFSSRVRHAFHMLGLWNP